MDNQDMDHQTADLSSTWGMAKRYQSVLNSMNDVGVGNRLFKKGKKKKEIKGETTNA